MLHKLAHEAGAVCHEAEAKAGKLVHEAEELVEEAEAKAGNLCQEAEGKAEELVAEAEAKAEHIFLEVEDEVEEFAEEIEAEVEAEVDDRLRNIKRSLTKHDPETDEEKPYPIVSTWWFHGSVTLLTLINTLQMGLEADHPDWTTVWLICENVFTAGFAAEMIIKLCICKRAYFKDMANWLDCSVTVLGMLDCWLLAIISGAGEGKALRSLSVLRILRLLRLARILKLIQSVKPLVLVIRGVVRAMSTAVYVFALCIFIFYVFALFCTEYFGKTDTYLYPGYSTEEEIVDDQEVMQNYNPYICWGSMLSSMLTLFNLAILTEWVDIVRPIALKQPLYLPVLLSFAICVGFGVMNVLIAVVVDVVTSESRRIEKEYHEEKKREKLATLNKIQKLLEKVDSNSNGTIDIVELKQAMEGSKHNHELLDLMGCIDLPSGWCSSELLDMLDNDGDGMLQYGEFTTSFFRLLDSDDFQQLCIMQASVNQVKHLIRDQHQQALTLQADITSIKIALGLAEESLPESARTQIHSVQKVKQNSEQSYPQGERLSVRRQSSSSKLSEQRDIVDPDEEVTKLKKAKQALSYSSGSSQGSTGLALVSSARLEEFLSSTRLLVKECIREEFAAIKPSLDSLLSCARPDFDINGFSAPSCNSLSPAAKTQSTHLAELSRGHHQLAAVHLNPIADVPGGNLGGGGSGNDLEILVPGNTDGHRTERIWSLRCDSLTSDLPCSCSAAKRTSL